MDSRAYMDVVPMQADHRIAYGPDPEQFGDLRLPAGPGPHPVVVVIHGGWWRHVYDLTYAGHMAAALTSDGYATWNIEYRRVGSPGGGYPVLLQDVSAAVAHLGEIAATYNLDMARIVVTGHSAGGHLAGWVAAKGMHRKLDVFGITPPIRGAVPVAGIMDLVRTSELHVNDAMYEFLGGSHLQQPELYALVSPAHLVPTGIPVTNVHGTRDMAVPIELSEIYERNARHAGDPTRLVMLDGIDHFDVFNPDTEPGRVVRNEIARLFA